MTSDGSIVIRFPRSTQSLGSLQEAAYRILDVASCRIDATESEYLCILHPKSAKGRDYQDCLDLHAAFLDKVTDENLREKIGAETQQVRNLLLALAFGAWSRPSSAEKGP